MRKGMGGGCLPGSTGPLGLASWILFYVLWKCRELDFPLDKLSAGGASKGWGRGRGWGSILETALASGSGAGSVAKVRSFWSPEGTAMALMEMGKV